MCGIALIISGVRINSSTLHSEYGYHDESPSASASEAEVHKPRLSVEHLKAALQRRGPDHLGSRKVFLQLNRSNSVEKEENNSSPNIESVGYTGEAKKKSFSVSYTTFEVTTAPDASSMVMESDAELQFLGATLQLRGITPVLQPLLDDNGNLLIFNGEVFGGIDVKSGSNDTEVLMRELGSCSSCDCHGLKRACYCTGEERMSVPELLSIIKGPYAVIYWQARSKTIWFGRDAFGRRSLLVHWPTSADPRFLLSSVSPPPSGTNTFDLEVADKKGRGFWEELSCGIYSISFNAMDANDQGNLQNLVGEIRRHNWTDFLLKKLIKWDRASFEPKPEEFCLHSAQRKQDVLDSAGLAGQPLKPGIQQNHVKEKIKPHADIMDSLTSSFLKPDLVVEQRGPFQYSVQQPVHRVLYALRESVMRRTTMDRIVQTTLHETRVKKLVPLALLFSGGLDSMILAALLDQCLNSIYDIDLLNVSFDGQLAPDRISGRTGLKELQRVSPSRRWRLVEIDAELSCLAPEIQHVMSLINPAKTYMDLNIGIALWLAANGDGWVDEEICNLGKGHQRFKYKSEAKILLVGSGADEQCAGYTRHRTKYKLAGWHALEEEMKLDMQRIWRRNLGRDDRCISDNGKEARFPFLDEDVIRTLLEIPLREVAELDQPVGRGDKKILREVARLLGLEAAAVQPKRAIQFGSRIARESNRKNFGSNRAANQASAGSMVIHDRSTQPN